MPRTVETPTDIQSCGAGKGLCWEVSLPRATGCRPPRARFLQTKGLGHHRIVTNADVITEALGFLEQAGQLDSDVPERLDLGA
ncbi:MAG: hypothetical protein QOF10_3565 [Kribbellaceae bacterium]|jgi:hypothetical protein|nr:hypothetical protein [Kribbellaceae bacterium]